MAIKNKFKNKNQSFSGNTGFNSAVGIVAVDTGATTNMLNGLNNPSAYFGLSGTAWGGIAMGSGLNGNSPFVAATKDGSGSALSLRLMTNATIQCTIDPNGNMFTGKQSYSATVSGNQFGSFTGSGMKWNETVTDSTDTTGSGSIWYLNRQSSVGYMFQFRQAVNNVGSITVTSSATNYNTTSDYRLKDVIGPINNAETFIAALKPVYGTWKIDGSPFVGFVAHEFAEVSPSSVHGVKDAVLEDGTPDYQSMQASSPEVMANVIAELQALRKYAQSLEARLTALENK